MAYNKKPKMILFDVGGTLFKGGNFSAANGFSALLNHAENTENISVEKLEKLWNEYYEEVGKLKSESGKTLDIPLSAVIKYVTMNAGLELNISMTEQEEIFDRFNSQRTVIDGVPQLLDTINSLGIRAAVISNNAMSGESLALAIRQWLPDSSMEFCLTSADLLFCKPYKLLFEAAANYAHLSPEDCWYCGDGRIPDVDGARNAGMTPVLLDISSPLTLEMRTDGDNGEYMAVNHWNVLTEYLKTL